MAIARFRWHVLLYGVLTPLVLPASNASAFFFNPSLNFINPADGILTGNTNGSASLDVAPRWDSVDRNDGVGTNHSLAGGLTYNFDNGGTVAGYFADFTFSDGTTAAQFAAAVTAALNAWSSAAPITFTKTNTAVVLNDDVTKNQVGGNEIDFFGKEIPSLGRTGIVGVDQRVRLTNGFSTGGGTFPSTRIYSADVEIDTDENWTLRAWQSTFTHEIGHALGLGHPDNAGHFYDTDNTINNVMPINIAGDVRTGLTDRQATKNGDPATFPILMNSMLNSPPTVVLSNDDIGGIQFLYPVPEPSSLVLFGLGLVGVSAFERRWRRRRAA